MPTLTINGQSVTVGAGTSVLQAALGSGVEVPHYCWHPGLGPEISSSGARSVENTSSISQSTGKLNSFKQRLQVSLSADFTCPFTLTPLPVFSIFTL